MIKHYWVLVALGWSSMVAAQTTNYVYDTTTNSTSTSTNTNNNNNTSSSTSSNTNTNVNQNINSGTVTNVNQTTATTTNVNQNINSGTMTNINQNTSASTTTADNTNRNFNTDVSNSTVNSTSNATTNNTNVNQNNNVNLTDSKSTSYSENVSRQIIDQNLKSPPPSAIAPSMMSYSQDLCTTGVSGAVQTQIVGISGGKAMRDQNCERIKLSKTLYDMGMRVAAVSLLCQDDRVFRSMEMAGTPCPFMGLIGAQASDAWKENADKRPDAKGK
jgi:hypothetical protein